MPKQLPGLFAFLRRFLLGFGFVKNDRTGRYGAIPDRYGECFGYDLSQYDYYYKNLAIGALRYAEWGAQTVLLTPQLC